jgi:hypothetical protein
MSLNIANGELSCAFQDKIKFVGAIMRVNLLCLTGLQTIQTNHHAVALPQSGLVELLFLRSCMTMPIEKVVHRCGYLVRFWCEPKLTQAIRNDEALAALNIAPYIPSI